MGHRLGLLARVPACAQRESAVARSAKRKLAIGATGTADRLGAATEDVAAAGGAAVDAAAASRVPPPSKISLPRPTMSPVLPTAVEDAAAVFCDRRAASGRRRVGAALKGDVARERVIEVWHALLARSNCRVHELPARAEGRPERAEPRGRSACHVHLLGAAQGRRTGSRPGCTRPGYTASRHIVLRHGEEAHVTHLRAKPWCSRSAARQPAKPRRTSAAPRRPSWGSPWSRGQVAITAHLPSAAACAMQAIACATRGLSFPKG